MACVRAHMLCNPAQPSLALTCNGCYACMPPASSLPHLASYEGSIKRGLSTVYNVRVHALTSVDTEHADGNDARHLAHSAPASIALRLGLVLGAGQAAGAHHPRPLYLGPSILLALVMQVAQMSTTPGTLTEGMPWQTSQAHPQPHLPSVRGQQLWRRRHAACCAAMEAEAVSHAGTACRAFPAEQAAMRYSRPSLPVLSSDQGRPRTSCSPCRPRSCQSRPHRHHRRRRRPRPCPSCRQAPDPAPLGVVSIFSCCSRHPMPKWLLGLSKDVKDAHTPSSVRSRALFAPA